MSSVYSSYAAGRAAYARGPSASEKASSAESPSAPDDTQEAPSGSQPQDTALDKTAPSNLTTQEQQMIEERFPEDPELSMRLYGRGRDAQTVRSNSLGGNLDVTG
jgi:hypothetical protein